MSKFGQAVIAFLVAGTGALAVAGTDNAVTLGEGLVVLATGMAAFGTVYGVQSEKLAKRQGGDG